MAAFSFHCSERWPLGSPPFVTLLLKAVTLKGEGFLSSSYSSGITLGSGHLLFTCGSCACVPNNRCQSGGRRCTHTDYATCSAGLDSYTGSCDLRFDASRERFGRGGEEHCPRVCSRALTGAKVGSFVSALQVFIYQGHKSEFIFLHMG